MEFIHQFIRLYFRGLKTDSYFQPSLKAAFENIPVQGTDLLVKVFIINLLTDLINDENEIREDRIFMFDGNFYSIGTLVSTYKYNNVFFKQGISLKADDIRIDYDEDRDGLSTTRHLQVPKAKWQPVKLLLRIKHPPFTNGYEHLNWALVGLEIPISLMEIGYQESDGFLICPKKTFIAALSKHDKAAVDFWSRQPGTEIFLNPDCVELI